MRLAICRFDEQGVEQAMKYLSLAGLSDMECKRLDGIRNPSARAASVAARVALLWALTEGDGQVSVHDLGEIPPIKGQPLSLFRRTETGPSLVGSDMTVSLAHSDRIAVCAVTEAGRIGVDVEPLNRHLMHADSIAKHYFSEGERSLLDGAPDRHAAFLRIWTRKEALGKALGTGLQNSSLALDTAAQPEERFVEHTVEGTLISVFSAPEKAGGI